MLVRSLLVHLVLLWETSTGMQFGGVLLPGLLGMSTPCSVSQYEKFRCNNGGGRGRDVSTQLEWGLRQDFEFTRPGSQHGRPSDKATLPLGRLFWWLCLGLRLAAAQPCQGKNCKQCTDACSRYGCTGKGRKVMNLQSFFNLVDLRGDSPYSCLVQVELKAACSFQRDCTPQGACILPKGAGKVVNANSSIT